MYRRRGDIPGMNIPKIGNASSLLVHSRTTGAYRRKYVDLRIGPGPVTSYHDSGRSTEFGKTGGVGIDGAPLVFYGASKPMGKSG
jgi:hypothetical protein